MTTIDPSPAATGESRVGRLLATDVDWLTTTDHKKTGRLLLGAGLLTSLLTVLVNVVIAIERVDTDGATFDRGAWAQLLGAHQIGLVFGTALPLAAGLAVAVTPLQLGARALALPRLTATGAYMWFGGFVLSVIALANNGGPGGGDADMVDLSLASLGLMALGFTAIGASLITSVLTTRAPGMTMRRVPAFAWSSLVFGLALVLVMPVLLGTVIYLFVDHRSGARTAFGGNEGVARWAGWIFTQPTTFLVAIPAVGVLADVVPTTFRTRTPLRGAVFAGIALVGVGALAGVTQQERFAVPWNGSNLYIGGGDDIATKIGDLLPWAIFHLLPILGVTILLATIAFVAKPRKDDDGETIRPRITGALPFALFGVGMVHVGMLGAAIEPIVDLGLIGTVFSEGSLVYVTYGTALAVLGGIARWSPKLWGPSIEMKAAAPLALVGVGGTVLASLPLYVAGFLDQEAGLSSTDGGLGLWNILVLVGHVLMALALLGFIGLLASTVRRADPAGDDPIDGHTLEWATTSPAPADNYVDTPTVTSAEPILDRKTANEPATAGSAS
ncbi:cbb3-type cytochrome c oxidase subunit I [Ilumatobacter sp.]|uniref:cbb3-type cytochrome c oxidase subunit I n=1 Tax=Ilumatobacter sp. TaxID=1967498 RepID=UPI003B524DFD